MSGESPAVPVRVVVMGVSGAGKSMIGDGLAEALRASYVEGDDLHPKANRDKMAAGHPLDDDDRWPWLDKIGQVLRETPGPVVVTCSALKRSYRDKIREAAPGVFFVHLDGDPDLLRERQAERKGHFMPAGLMDSQFATLEPLEPDEPGVRLDVDANPYQLVAEAQAALTSAGDR